MRQDLIVNAKEERKRKQSINSYDFPFNPAVFVGSPPGASNLYGLSKNFVNLSAIQNEYDQYLQFYSMNYANAYYMHNNLDGFNTNLINSLNGNKTYTQSTVQSSKNPIDTHNQLDNLNSLNQINYSSSIIPPNPFIFHKDNSNGSFTDDANNYLTQQQLINSPPSGLHSSSSSLHLDPTGESPITSSNPLLAASIGSPTNYHRNRYANKESKINLSFLNKSPSETNDSDELILTRQINKLSFASHSDENATDGFDRYVNDYDKLDLSKLNLNRLDSNNYDLNKQSFPSSLSSSSSCSSISSQLNSFEHEQSKLINYNWKKRKIQYLTDEEIEKENRKAFRTLTRQSQLVKRQRLEEILKASKRIMKQPDYKLSDCKLNENPISRGHLLEALKWQFFGITKLCKAFQEISAYKKLEETEKKYLLMANCTYILMLSSTKYYNAQTHEWEINVKLDDPESKRIKMPVPVEVLDSGTKKELASYYISFMEIFDRNWLEDEILMTLIFVIALFNPSDDNLIKKINNIKYEHECYLSLLEDYLEKKLKSKEKVKSQTNRIKQFLTKLAEFKEMFETAHVVLAKEETSQLYRHLSDCVLNH